MAIPYGVIAVYFALAVWLGLLIRAWRRGAYGLFLTFGVGLLIVLNARYAFDQAANAIAFFIGIYDVPDNLGVSHPATAAALGKCLDNACTVWGDRYAFHPTWGVAFYNRFLHQGFRTDLLQAHILFNTIAFVLMMVQIALPGDGPHPARHRVLGYASLASLTLGVGCACLLAAEHGSVADYGGYFSVVGFWFLAACSYVCAIMGVVSIRRGDTAAHRRWMFRYAGAMWGAFWLFRVMLFVLGPILRDYNTVALLICIWFSGPLGILIGDFAGARTARREARVGAKAAHAT